MHVIQISNFNSIEKKTSKFEKKCIKLMKNGEKGCIKIMNELNSVDKNHLE